MQKSLFVTIEDIQVGNDFKKGFFSTEENST